MSPITEQLEHGVRVKCKDGTVVECAALSLRDAVFFIEQWDRLSSEDLRERITARTQMALRFAEAYPELAPHIGGGDVEALIPAFFWKTTGAQVVAPKGTGNGSTGTKSARSTARSGT